MQAHGSDMGVDIDRPINTERSVFLACDDEGSRAHRWVRGWVCVFEGTTLAVIVGRENDPKRGTMTKKLKISGMTCDHCVSHVKSALEGVEGVSDADVSLENHEAELTLSSEVIDADLIAAVETAGYEAEVH